MIGPSELTLICCMFSITKCNYIKIIGSPTSPTTSGPSLYKRMPKNCLYQFVSVNENNAEICSAMPTPLAVFKPRLTIFSFRCRSDPYGAPSRDPYARPADPYARDAYSRDSYAAPSRDSYAAPSRDPYDAPSRDPYAPSRSSYATSSQSSDPYARSSDPYASYRQPASRNDYYSSQR